MYEVVQIPYEATKDWIPKHHYAKRMPSISYAYGLYRYDEMVGMVSYGSPASPCVKVSGEEHKSDVIELNRLVLKITTQRGIVLSI